MKKKNNMYDWIDSCRNFVGGKCSYMCSYCYVQKNRFENVLKRYNGPLNLLEKEFKKPFGQGKTVFIQNMGDLFAEDVPTEWIKKVLTKCLSEPSNTYLFQTKNPKRYQWFYQNKWFPTNTILCITLETNRNTSGVSDAPSPVARVADFAKIGGKKVVTIEPILAFDLDEFVDMIKLIKPDWVNIGADSKKCDLPEPSWNKVKQLITELNKFTEIKEKSNLERLKP